MNPRASSPISAVSARPPVSAGDAAQAAQPVGTGSAQRGAAAIVGDLLVEAVPGTRSLARTASKRWSNAAPQCGRRRSVAGAAIPRARTLHGVSRRNTTIVPRSSSLESRCQHPHQVISAGIFAGPHQIAHRLHPTLRATVTAVMSPRPQQPGQMRRIAGVGL